MKKVYLNLKSAVNELGGLGRNSYTLLVTVVRRLSFHLHLDRNLGKVMSNGGILSSSLGKIKKEIDNMEAIRRMSCETNRQYY